MIRRADFTASDTNGTPEPGVYITVKTATGALATLFNDNASSLANPFQSGTLGAFVYNVTTEGVYTEEYRLSPSESPRKVIELELSLSGQDGLLVNAPTLIVPIGTDMVATTGADALDHGGANYVAGTKPTTRSGFTSANARNFVLSKEQTITPQMFYQATDSDFQNAMEGMRDYLNTFNLNSGGSGFYNGAPKAVCPAAQTYLMHERVDFTHSGIVEGEGDGFFGPGSGGCTHFKWTAGSGGFGVQAPNTSSITDFDNGTLHDGSGGLDLSKMCLEGPFSGTEGEVHGLILRNAIRGTDLYIKSWPGEGVHAWAGNINGGSNVSGNLSTTRLIGIKTEGCRGGNDRRGSDANVMTLVNCQGYQNRWFGDLDDNGAGSNDISGTHNASNGVVTGTWAQTQCSSAGNRYALKWGGDPTVAPSGTTADTVNWFYIEAGGAVANLIPAWVNTPGTFRAGGDYLTLNSAGVLHSQPYSETGGFSQFNTSTLIHGGTLTTKYYRGGVQVIPNGTDGIAIKTHGNGHLDLDMSGAEAGLQIRELEATGTILGYFNFVRGDAWWMSAPGGLNNVIGPYKVAGTQVIGARRTGWTADTGTAKRTANATYAAGTTLTYSAGYVQAEQTAMATRMAAVEAALQNISQTQKAVKDDLITHGAIGA